MERITIRIPEKEVERVERIVEEGGFSTRSEAVRSAVRELVDEYENRRNPRRVSR